MTFCSERREGGPGPLSLSVGVVVFARLGTGNDTRDVGIDPGVDGGFVSALVPALLALGLFLPLAILPLLFFISLVDGCTHVGPFCQRIGTLDGTRGTPLG